MDWVEPSLSVDVVVDVASRDVDRPFTYSAGTEGMPALGTRVKVPFNGRLVRGWVVGHKASAGRQIELKPIAEIDLGSAHLDASAILLASWLRRRYACTFREALLAVASRAGGKSVQPRYVFIAAPPTAMRVALLLHRALGQKPFAAVRARGILKQAGMKMTLPEVLAQLERLTRAHLVGRQAPLQPKRRRTAAGLHSVTVRVEPGTEALAALSATEEQAAAIESLDCAIRRGPINALLHGVTGSGKTFVYTKVIDRLRSRGATAIVLVPEISLTPQTAMRMRAAFGSRVGVLHSGLSESEKKLVWSAAGSGDIDIVVGARSAVYAPLPRLGLIVVDEEHEPSYKQDVAPRYDAGVVAQKRMADCGGSVILASATPSLESYQRALSGEIQYVRMLRRATAAPLPPVQIVDMSGQGSARQRRPLSPRLVAAMEKTLGAGRKTLLFVNRRGYAGLMLCRSCGFVPRCRRCAVSLVIHTADGSMRCHICGAAFRLARSCPKCDSDDVRPFGFGTQRVEEEVRGLFPHARVVRMDSDSTARRGAHGTLLESFDTDGDVLIGTQMIAKGLDFPGIDLVGVVAADIDLNRPDFRAAERTFALLTQVAGRAGRAEAGSSVIVQTYSPEHYAVRFAAEHDYEAFAAEELALRKELRYPPFGRLAYVGVTGSHEAAVTAAARATAESLRRLDGNVEILGPAADPLPKARGDFRMRIALKADSEEELLDACALVKAMRQPPAARAYVVVDPR
ncbi:MAG: primosomal protein N' [Candidatus Eremiobacteraeota bacterium]|nr:primosomal protein N' [Candidatus Eremiobacteraeota bacterium]